MLTKIVKGKNFDGVLRYIFSKPKAKLVCQNLQGSTITDRVNEFNEVWSQRKRVQRPVFHVSLSLPKGEEIEKRKWKRIVEYYLKGMGFQDCRYVAVRHRDREHDHVHIVASRVTDAGLLVSDSWDYLKSQAIARRIEKRYHLTPTPSSSECLATSPSVLERRQGVESVRTQLQRLIEQQARSSLNFTELRSRLLNYAVEITFKMEGNYRTGIIYHAQNFHFSGSNLGRGFTEYGLHRYLLGKGDVGGLQGATSHATNPKAITNPQVNTNPSPWLSHQQAGKLYKKYAQDTVSLVQVALKAVDDGWNWDSIRFILSRGPQFDELKQKRSRRFALKCLNAVIASVSDPNTLPAGMEFEKRYISTQLYGKPSPRKQQYLQLG